jgi:L-phenylalanine/L-methionine N-acetyltransferase
MTTNITIRAAEPTDAAAISALIGSEGVFEGTSQLPLMPVASRVERYAKMDVNNLALVAVVQPAEGEQVVGNLGLFVLNPSLRRMHVRGLGIAVHHNWQGQGVGQRLMTAAMDWADNWAGILRIELNVFADNTRAIALYERHGFVKEGLMKAYSLRGGVYEDTWAMARLHPNPPKLAG